MLGKKVFERIQRSFCLTHKIIKFFICYVNNTDPAISGSRNILFLIIRDFKKVGCGYISEKHYHYH